MTKKFNTTGRTFSYEYDGRQYVASRVKLGSIAMFDNFRYIVTDDEQEVTVGVMEDDTCYFLHDRVEIEGDIRGYITPGIKKPGMGEIIEIQKNFSDHFYGIAMDSGEYGHVKSARIKRVIPR